MGFAVLARAALLVGFSKTAVSGADTVSLAIFAAVLPARASTGVLLPVLIAGDVPAVLTCRRHAHWPTLWRLFPAVAVCVVAGILFSTWADERRDAVRHRCDPAADSGCHRDTAADGRTRERQERRPARQNDTSNGNDERGKRQRQRERRARQATEATGTTSAARTTRATGTTTTTRTRSPPVPAASRPAPTASTAASPPWSPTRAVR